ncbi:MAG: phosphoenolpyruvate carboxykinase [Lachnospira pectinoschiza]|jgi:hypothetical protein
MSKKLKSVFTDNMDECILSGSTTVERHHIFGGSNRKKSEKYGFVVPLRPDLHPNGVYAGQSANVIDLRLKKMAQKYYEENYGTREYFIQEFGRNYL